MLVPALLNYIYDTPTPLLNYRYYSQARSQNSAMVVGCCEDQGAELPALENFVFFLQK